MNSQNQIIPAVQQIEAAVRRLRRAADKLGKDNNWSAKLRNEADWLYRLAQTMIDENNKDETK